MSDSRGMQKARRYCNICQDFFADGDNMRNHNAYCHTTLYCTLCEKSFPSGKDFLEHSKKALQHRVGGNISRIQCVKCHRDFNTYGQWTKHTGEHMVKCIDCNQFCMNLDDHVEHGQKCGERRNSYDHDMLRQDTPMNTKNISKRRASTELEHRGNINTKKWKQSYEGREDDSANSDRFASAKRSQSYSPARSYVSKIVHKKSYSNDSGSSSERGNASLRKTHQSSMPDEVSVKSKYSTELRATSYTTPQSDSRDLSNQYHTSNEDTSVNYSLRDTQSYRANIQIPKQERNNNSRHREDLLSNNSYNGYEQHRSPVRERFPPYPKIKKFDPYREPETRFVDEDYIDRSHVSQDAYTGQPACKPQKHVMQNDMYHGDDHIGTRQDAFEEMTRILPAKYNGNAFPMVYETEPPSKSPSIQSYKRFYSPLAGNEMANHSMPEHRYRSEEGQTDHHTTSRMENSLILRLQSTLEKVEKQLDKLETNSDAGVAHGKVVELQAVIAAKDVIIAEYRESAKEMEINYQLLMTELLELRAQMKQIQGVQRYTNVERQSSVTSAPESLFDNNSDSYKIANSSATEVSTVHRPHTMAFSSESAVMKVNEWPRLSAALYGQPKVGTLKQNIRDV